MTSKLKEEIRTFSGKRSLTAVLIVIVVTTLLTFLLPEDPADFGIFTTVPALFLIIYIFVTKRILESLTLAAVVGFIMVSRGDALDSFSTSYITGTFATSLAL